jgi:hypothetical protein
VPPVEVSFREQVAALAAGLQVDSVVVCGRACSQVLRVDALPALASVVNLLLLGETAVEEQIGGSVGKEISTVQPEAACLITVRAGLASLPEPTPVGGEFHEGYEASFLLPTNFNRGFHLSELS